MEIVIVIKLTTKPTKEVRCSPREEFQEKALSKRLIAIKFIINVKCVSSSGGYSQTVIFVIVIRGTIVRGISIFPVYFLILQGALEI